VPWQELLAANLAVAMGALVQAATGIGGGFVMVPLLAWINLALIPAPIMFASLILSCLMMIRGRAHMNVGLAAWMLLGLVPGSILGAWLLTVIGWQGLGVLFAVMILLAVGISAIRLHPRLNRRNALLAGALAGTMGASAGIGAPVMALMLQDQAGVQMRANLAVLYTGASLIMLAILALFGRFGAEEAMTGITLMPGFIAGFVFAGRLHRHVDAGRSRPVVLALSALAAFSLLWRSF
jgi:uncharacterized protein